MRSLVAGAGMRLGAVQNADQAAYLLMYRTPVFLLVGVAAERAGRRRGGGWTM